MISGLFKNILVILDANMIAIESGSGLLFDCLEREPNT